MILITQLSHQSKAISCLHWLTLFNSFGLLTIYPESFKTCRWRLIQRTLGELFAPLEMQERNLGSGNFWKILQSNFHFHTSPQGSFLTFQDRLRNKRGNWRFFSEFAAKPPQAPFLMPYFPPSCPSIDLVHVQYE